MNADGLCPMHAGTTDPRELGRRSARARRQPNAKRVPQSLREYLRAEVPPREVWAALKAALEGSSEAARVSAARVLLDALHEQQNEQDWRKRMASEMQVAADDFDRRFAQRAERARDSRRQELAEILEPLGLAGLADEDELELVRALAGRLAAIPEPVRQEHAA